LAIHLLGDIIDGQLHDPRNGAPLAEQMARAIHILSQAIAYLSGRFKKVKVYCVAGNHGRNTSRHHDRAVNQKWDSFENAIYFAVKTALVKCDNVEFSIPYTAYYVIDQFGMKGFFTHGDTVMKPGYPGKNIDVAGLHRQANEFNAKHSDGDRYVLFAVGHVHIAADVTLPNGEVVITNGALVPSDAYATSIGIMNTWCCQQLWETVPGIMFGDHRRLNVGVYNDKDSSLDKIIKPFESL
jgi:hypothetical protein